MEDARLSVDDIIITDRLSERLSRLPDYAAESRALEALAKELADHPENLLQKLADTIVELGIGDSAGVSIEEMAEFRQFRWVALAGVRSQLRGSTIPFDASPCGLAVRRDQMLLIESPERFFAEAQVEPLIHEGLLVPFHANGRPVGTLWINLHSPDRTFDREDARLLQSLARFASAAHQMVLALEASEASRLESDSRLRALAHASSEVFYIMSPDMRELRELSGGNFIPDATSPSRDWLQDYIPSDGHAQALAAIRHAIQTKGVFELEHQVRRVNGELGWAMSRAVPILGTDGEIMEWFGSASDVTERKHAEVALRETQEELKASFGGMRLIYNLQAQLAQETDLRAALERIIDTASACLATNHGCIQLVSDDGKRLEMFAWRGYAEDSRFVRHFLREGSKAACDAARQDRKRVIIEDVETFPGLAGTVDREVALEENIRATQHTPISSRDGELLGVLSSQFDRPHRPLDEQLKLIDLLGWTAADFIERHHAITALRASEERQAFLLKLSDVLRPLSDPVGLQEAACRALGEHLRVDRAYYVEINNTTGLLRIGPNYLSGNQPSLEGDMLLSDYGWTVPILQSGEMIAVNDTHGSSSIPDADRAAMAAVGVQAVAAALLIKGGTMIGCLAVNCGASRDWLEPELELIRETGERIWAAIERARAEADLRESEEKYRSLFETMGQGYGEVEIVRDADGRAIDHRYVEINSAYERLVGIPAAQAKGRLASEIIPGLEPSLHETFGRIARGGVPEQFEVPVGPLDSWFSVFAYPQDGDRLILLYEDVTDRKRAEAALRENQERLQAALTAADLGTWVWHVAEDRTESDARSLAHFGMPADQPARLADALANYFHPDDSPRYASDVVQAIDPAGTGKLHGEYRIRRPDGLERWIAISALTSFEGVPPAASRMTGAMTDVTDRKRSEAALRESEERLRQFGEASQDVLWIRDAEHLQWQYLTPAFEPVYGVSREEALTGDNYRSWLDFIVPEDRDHAAASIDRVRHGEHITFEFRIRRPSDGAIRWMRNTDFPISDESGKVVLIGGVGHDMTDLKAVQAAIAESEGRLRTLMEGIPQLVWRSCAEGRWTWASPQWLDFTGQRQEETHGLGWLDAVHPDDHEATLLAWEVARPHGMLDVEYRVRHAADGAWLWHHTRSVPVRDGEGSIVEWLGTSTDVHALRELQERQGVLVAELQHRTRNLITVVRSLSDRTVGNAASLDDFKGRFGRRLAALARVQGLLSHLSAGERVDFDELLRSELTALGVADGKAERVTLDGPSEVPLRSATVQTLALAVHELATNAVKYGALATDADNAHLAVRWHVEPATASDPPILHVDWRESGVNMPHVGAPAHGGGYGRELIERALPYQLGAETTYEFGVDGVRCTIEMPIAREHAHAE